MSRRPVLVLLVLVLLGSALSVVLALTRPEGSRAGVPPGRDDVYRPADLLGPSGEALAAAVAGLPLTLTYDHRDLDGALASATEAMTRAYAATFTRTFDRTVRPFARKRDAVTEARVRAAGVVRTRSDDAVVALVYVDQLLVAGTRVRRGEPPRVLGRSRVLVDLVLRDGTWRIAEIRVV